MMNDTLAAALSNILNQEKVGKNICVITPISKTIKKVFEILNEEGYVGSLDHVTEVRGGEAKINLLGNLNKCGAIKPRFSVSKDGYEKFEKRYLPSKNMGVIIVSTSKGMMTHIKAKEQELGGRLIAYCY